MRVRLVKKATLEHYAANNARIRSSLRIWLSIVKHADWSKPADIAESFASAHLIGNGSDRVVFDLGGNNFRMICNYFFGETKVHLFINWIGTHAEYSALCDQEKQYTITQY